MRTTVTMEESLVSELVEVFGGRTKTAAVVSAVKEQIRLAKLRKLAGVLGTIAVDGKAVRDGRRADRVRARRTSLAGAGRGR